LNTTTTIIFKPSRYLRRYISANSLTLIRQFPNNSATFYVALHDQASVPTQTTCVGLSLVMQHRRFNVKWVSAIAGASVLHALPGHQP